MSINKMTNKEIWQIAREQSAKDLCAEASDFEKTENVIVISGESDGARRYLTLPFSCQLVSYGSNVVASVLPEYKTLTESYISKYPIEHIFETPNLHVLNEKLMEKGQKICFMAEYFLPDIDLLRPLECPYELRVLTPADFANLYLPGLMLSARSAVTSTSSALEHTITGDSSVLQAHPPIVTQCGR